MDAIDSLHIAIGPHAETVSVIPAAGGALTTIPHIASHSVHVRK